MPSGFCKKAFQPRAGFSNQETCATKKLTVMRSLITEVFLAAALGSNKMQHGDNLGLLTFVYYQLDKSICLCLFLRLLD